MRGHEGKVRSGPFEQGLSEERATEGKEPMRAQGAFTSEGPEKAGVVTWDGAGKTFAWKRRRRGEAVRLGRLRGQPFRIGTNPG